MSYPSAYVCSDFGLRLLTEWLRPGDVAVDVGASVGAFTMPMARVVGPTGTVLAVEPDPENFGVLARSVVLNGRTNVTGFWAAAGEASGSLLLHRSTINRDSHQMWPDPSRCQGSGVVQVGTVDDLCDGRDVALIKADAQGWDLKVLRGAEKTITRQKRLALHVELWPLGLEGSGDSVGELVNFLFDHDFAVYRIQDAWQGKRLARLVCLPHQDNLLRLAERVRGDDGGFADLWCVKVPRVTDPYTKSLQGFFKDTEEG